MILMPIQAKVCHIIRDICSTRTRTECSGEAKPRPTAFTEEISRTGEHFRELLLPALKPS